MTPDFLVDHYGPHLPVPDADAAIEAADVTAALAGPATPRGGELRGARDGRLTDAVELHLQRYFDLHGDQLPPPGLYDRIMREVERPLIQIALDACSGNQLRCADLLGINRNTLRKKLTTYGLLNNQGGN